MAVSPRSSGPTKAPTPPAAKPRTAVPAARARTAAVPILPILTFATNEPQSVADILATIESTNSLTPPIDYPALLDVLPTQVVDYFENAPQEIRDGLAELVFDLGRQPHFLYMPTDMSGLKHAYLDNAKVDEATINSIVEKIGEFSPHDNRAGIPGTLHRISRKQNRTGKPIGLTIRAGRSCGVLHDLLESELAEGSSILFVGRPGSGKTTLVRDCAARLAQSKRVEIVDTSNEIAGDGDVPHPAVGTARRMMVSDRANQHRVMIEAVQNHTPQVLVIDEIGTAHEVASANDVAQRGIQLLASAHGTKISDVVQSPVLGKLLGGVQSVILSAQELRTRKPGGTESKSVVERKFQPAFDVLVEIVKPGCVVVVKDVGTAVDASLAGKPFAVEVRALQGDNVLVKQAVMEAGRGK